MILEQLTLRNFGLFSGEQTLNLAPAQRRGRPAPIVLIGGINGGGKTTLLDAVQLVLYGVRARCSKRNEKPYDQFLRESIHHGIDPAEGASVGLTFRYAADGEEELYEVSRAWSVSRSGVRETVRVWRDGELDRVLSDNWNQMVEELIPSGISQLFFFDAEKIRFLADDETGSKALGTAIKSLLGLDIAERLIADTAALEGRLARSTKKRSRESEQIELLEQELEAIEAERRQLKQSRADVENHLQQACNRVREAEEKFAQGGGRHWEQREERQRRAAELDNTVEGIESRLLVLAATELPFALIPDLIGAVAEQDRCERQAGEARVVAELLLERDQRLLARLREKRTSQKSLRLVETFLFEDRAERIEPAEVDMRLELSEAARNALGHLLGSGLQERLSETAVLLTELATARREQEDNQRELAATPDDESVSRIAEKLKEATKEFAVLEDQAHRLDLQIQTMTFRTNELDRQLTKLRRKVVNEQIREEEAERIGNLVVRTQETMRQFLQRATATKIDRLSEQITEAFSFLLRKKTLVARVQVDPGTFDITLFGQDGHPVPKPRLSEGEKQIFAVSVLWGLSRASTRPLPAIIDTPMGRLDVEHRNSLVERYFPNASHQVIILSTDTEIARHYFEELQPHMARAYHLDYDEQRKLTVAHEGYFWDTVSTPAEMEVTA